MRSEAGASSLNTPLNDPEAYVSAREDIQSRRASEPAESLMVGDVATIIGGILLSYCAAENAKFRIHYDPRSDKEDRRVFERISELIIPLQKGLFGRDDIFQGCCNTDSSSESAGLQMADHVARDLRSLFHNFPRLLVDSTSKELITPDETVKGGCVVSVQMKGNHYKWGEELRMEEELVRSIFESSGKFSLADYHDILISRKVSCYTNTGEARIVDFENFSFRDMVD